LEKKEHNITWFNSSFNHARKIQRCDKNKTIYISEKYKIKLIWANNYKNVSLDRVKHHIQTARQFRRLAYSMEKPDIILCSMPTIELAREATMYGYNMNIPVIIDIRDLWPDIFEEVIPRWAKIFIKPYIMYSRKILKNLLSEAYAITGLTH